MRSLSHKTAAARAGPSQAAFYLDENPKTGILNGKNM